MKRLFTVCAVTVSLLTAPAVAVADIEIKNMELEDDGDVYVDGSRKGEIQSDGDVYVNGSRVGEVESDGDIYRNGSRYAEVQEDGDIYIGGSRKGQIEDDGDIYIGGSRWATASNCCSSHAERARAVALIIFFASPL